MLGPESHVQCDPECGGHCVDDCHAGACQGSPTSCILFIIFVDELIKMMIKERCSPERFLEWMTLLFSTIRTNLIRKGEILDNFCKDYGMSVNNDKTKFFVLDGEDGDAEDVHVNDLTIEHCCTFFY